MLLAVSGGFRTTVGGLRISARSPLLVIVLALINFTIWLGQARRARAVDEDLQRVWDALEHHARAIIVAVALIAATVAVTFATRSAAGADASGYLSEAAAWAISPIPLTIEPIATEYPDADPWLTTPLGWRPADGGDNSIPGIQAPTYPPGLPLAIALPHALFGIEGAVATVVLAAAVAIVATGLIAAHIGGGIAGIVAAALIAFTPVFLYQSIQIMSDVPVTAAWMICWLALCKDSGSSRSMSLAAGIACAIAVLIRPNLAPLALVPLFIASHRIAFAVPVAAAGLGLAVLQTLWYGSPFRSGYGATEELFALSNILPNVGRYSRWWITTAPPLLVAIAGIYRLRANRTARAMAVFALLVIGAYLLYAVFDDWSYLRFLLPGLAVCAVFAAVAIVTFIERRPVRVRVPVVFAVLLAATSYGLWIARGHDTFKLADQLARVATVANHVRANLDRSAVLMSGEQSGSMRYYTERSILRWEAATPEALDNVLPKLEQSGQPVFIVLDAWEEPLFRAKLGAAVSLDWPPMLEAGTTHRTRLWRLSDRDRFARGESLHTIRLP